MFISLLTFCKHPLSRMLLIGITLIVFFIPACKEDGKTKNNDDVTLTNTDDKDDTTDSPKISGFNLNLQQGTFWEFGWDARQARYAQGSPGSQAEESGVYRVTLGEPTTIQGTLAFPVLMSGTSSADLLGDTPLELGPRWRYLAASDERILGSVDGNVLEVVFDAKSGYQSGGGFFHTLPNDTLVLASSGSISNDYINESAVAIGRSDNQNQCETIAGHVICGDSSFTIIDKEYFKEQIGPLGYRHINSYSFSGGGFGSGGSDNYNIGLLASSLQGDVVNHILEVEPNNAMTGAMLLQLPVVVKGGSTNEASFGETEPAYLTMVAESEPNDTIAGGQVIEVPNRILGATSDTDDSTSFIVDPNTVDPYTIFIEDWYVFTLTQSTRVTVTLDFSSSDDADLDLYLFHDGTVHAPQLAWENRDNVQAGEFFEKFTLYGIEPATYYLAVDAFNTPSGSVNYSLQINSCHYEGFSCYTDPNEIQITDWYRVVLETEQNIEITVSGSASVILTNTFLNNTFASARSVEGEAASTVESGLLPADDYLIGVGESRQYTLELSAQ